MNVNVGCTFLLFFVVVDVVVEVGFFFFFSFLFFSFLFSFFEETVERYDHKFSIWGVISS